MLTLGINAVYHDSAACLIQDGQVIAAAEEERFTRKKHAKRPIPFSTYELPYHAIHYCLQEAGIHLRDVDVVAYSYDPYILLGEHTGQETIHLPLEPSAHPIPEEWEAAWDPLFLSSIVNAPRQLIGGYPHHLQDRFRGASLDSFEWRFVEHHAAHAASAFFPSPFEQAAILTIDGRGEKATTSYSRGQGTRIERLGQVNMPHSLGLLYEKITHYLGFLTSSDEYKVMALASYGRPTFLEEFRRLVPYHGEGQYTVEPFDPSELFGPVRQKGEPFEQRHYDIAHSLQALLEERAIEIANWLHEATGLDNLCMSGGVALNCVMNAKISRLHRFQAGLGAARSRRRRYRPRCSPVDRRPRATRPRAALPHAARLPRPRLLE